ncbi:hypothetical protein SLEP1_g8160 [Rubroshorea leprosula]|uniref:Uncharacterized protein n=1 Tax=Rubroshorea leprosula TaxID=152421 RepID=A0AAV5I6Y2_9ROSI|nr:hypothetical protein SLEP1_g8160 [Rubroshorea leprosula]
MAATWELAEYKAPPPCAAPYNIFFAACALWLRSMKLTLVLHPVPEHLVAREGLMAK